MVKIKIDTDKDSQETIRKTIEFLKQFITEIKTETRNNYAENNFMPSNNLFGMFNDENSKTEENNNQNTDEIKINELINNNPFGEENNTKTEEKTTEEKIEKDYSKVFSLEEY